MKETKRRIEFYSLYDHTGIEKHLKKMAAKGWLITGIGSSFWKYRRIEPQKLKFSVVYLFSETILYSFSFCYKAERIYFLFSGICTAKYDIR